MRLWRIAFFVAWGAATWLFLAPIQPPTGAGDVPFFDKLAHVAVFAALAVLGRLAYRHRAPSGAFVALLAYALLIEVVQPYVGRAFEVADLLAGAIGALAAFLVPRRAGP